MVNVHESCQLTSLNDDVYCLILRELPTRDSLTLSTTCHALREALMPMLFGRAFVSVYSPWIVMVPEDFMPASLRPHVHTLVIYDSCPDQRTRDFECQYTASPKRCGVFPSAALAARLRELPCLRSLTISKKKPVVHGLAWSTVLAILSVPNLREVKLIGMYLCPLMYPEEDIRVDAHVLAPITTFHYQILHSPGAVCIPTETAALVAVLTELRDSLEMLVLTSESAPLSILAQLRWPRLRRLDFYGTPWTEHNSVVAALTTGMQCLRDLSFKLYTTTSQTKSRTYDRLQLSLPLERLVLSEPNPQDAVFEHLPPTLRALSLRNWPHLHFQQYLHDIASDVYDNPRYDILLDSSDVLSVLRRCVGLSLDQLEIEYRADEWEDALLQFMVVNFPHLTLLKLHRYRSALEQREGRDVSARHLAELLAPLSQLCRFKVYLDFVDMPRPRVVSLGPRLGFRYEYYPSQIQHCREVTLNTATVFAQVLSRALRVLMVRSVSLAGPIWRAFDIDSGMLLNSDQ